MRRPGGLWRHRDFLSLWSAETVSQFGSQVTFLALPLVAILVLDESTFRVALLTSVEFLPFLLFTLPAGVWVDRLRRRPILSSSDLTRALALSPLIPSRTGWACSRSGSSMPSHPAWGLGIPSSRRRHQSYLPALVGREQIVEGTLVAPRPCAAANIGGRASPGALVAALTAPVVLVDASASSSQPCCSERFVSTSRCRRARSAGRYASSCWRGSARAR